MKKLLTTILLASLFLSLTRCGTGKKNKKEEKPSAQKGEFNKIKKRAKALKKDADQAWDTLHTSETEKIESIERLLQEISYTKQYDPTVLKNLKAEVDTLKQLKLTRGKLRESENIDRYDSTTNALLERIGAFIENTPGTEKYTLIKRLWKEINQADNTLIRYRFNYDAEADSLNRFIEKNRDKLDSLGKPFKEMKKRGKYTIQQSS